jgi:hypothetical protein
MAHVAEYRRQERRERVRELGAWIGGHGESSAAGERPYWRWT